ncbi:MAG: hypothetical protein DHS20C15_07200 [Planctomycetota bacterium]|nr:MAG: hypothetical protein DHS20C15_07200 [Planctomycetota bacterium]
MNAALIVAALLAAPVFGMARAWMGPWAPDPTVVVLAWAALGGARTPRMSVVVLLGVGRALLLFEALGAQLLAACFAFLVLRAAREGLREIAGARPVFLGALLAGLAWCAAGRLLALVLDNAPLAGSELLLGALWALPFALLKLRARRRRGWA